ncbi:MAG: response regulator transcription factor [Candidatus Lindowbacteria bacterium]|nr:response regulator transcription factor [Candidatus Lindowbacteria bacterium]
MKILIIDDDEAITRISSIYLSKAGHSVQIAEDGSSAMKSLLEEIPDVVLLDFNLPDIKGPELLVELRKNGLEKTPIIFMTAQSSQHDETRYINMGAQGLIPKPIRPGNLESAIQAILERSSHDS